MKKFLMATLFICLLLLVACTKEQNQGSDVNKDISNDREIHVEDTNVKVDIIEETNPPPLLSYFMEEGKIAHYKGDWEENSNFMRTEYLSENYIIIYEGNGGRGTLTTYRVEENRIYIVKEEFGFPIDNKQDQDQLELELDSLPLLFDYLRTPFEVASELTEYNKFIVTDVSATVETHYGTFDNAIIIEFMNAYEHIQRRYLVEGFGEVKREYYYAGEVERVVAFSLEKIE